MLWAKCGRTALGGLAAVLLLGGAALLGTAAALPDTFYVSAGEPLTVASLPWVKEGKSRAGAAPAEAARTDKSRNVTLTDEQLCEIVRDNPAGQEGQCTPFILIRKKA